jgi:hypothetical protein
MRASRRAGAKTDAGCGIAGSRSEEGHARQWRRDVA